MPTKRILLTLGDIKDLVAKEYKVTKDFIETYNLQDLVFEDTDGQEDIKEESYLFQIDFEVK